MSSALNEPKWVALHSISDTTYKHASQAKVIIDFV